MKRRLPPLRALQAFEAAARTDSFTRAARELNVTPPAISSQVKLLESHLEVELFQRRPQSLVLTRAGRTYYEALTDAFAMMEAATQRIARTEKLRSLSIAIPPAFSSGWLIPRLAHFRSSHGFDVNLTNTARAVEPSLEGFEAVIRLGRGGWPGLVADYLFTEGLVPVCAPRKAPTGRAPGADWTAGETLLVSLDDAEAWDDWLRRYGKGPAGQDRVHFGDSWMAAQAAMAGMGAALCDRTIVAPDLSSGRLVIAGPEEPLARGVGYFLVYKKPLSDQLAAFREWLFEQTTP